MLQGYIFVNGFMVLTIRDREKNHCDFFSHGFYFDYILLVQNLIKFSVGQVRRRKKTIRQKIKNPLKLNKNC